ncbi:MAG: glycine cleavage system aminomethyltransferase GcvT [Fimbriimonadaceae bacterium]
MDELLLHTPLYSRHGAEGGRMVPFAGYAMPIQYASIIAEARAVRLGAGMFDVSHMARLKVYGVGVEAFLEFVTTNDVSRLLPGQGQYSLLPNERGGCVDDIIIYCLADGVYRMVVNAANHEKDVAWLEHHKPAGVHIEDRTETTFMVAVQGPTATETLATLSDQPEAFRSAPAFGIVEADVAGTRVFAARSGYTGEDGYELIGASGDADGLWQALREAGVAACGLASRDTLRVEAGLPLYGHELAEDLNPIAAGLGWVVSKTKSFIGAEAINAARTEGTPAKLQGIRLAGKRLTTPGMTISVDHEAVGTITSGVISPLLDCGIAFAFVRSDVPLNTPCTVEIRGSDEPATIVSKRFFKRPAS